ncbi:MAG: MaoC family dehydratase [Chloroflexi bacterium]|nr:MaoC family dehydratase [Chloroflexota bacterium]
MNPGQQATRTMTIDADVVRKFAEITGDYNPLHFEEGFAAKTRFGRLIAQGGLATGLLHALVAMELPGAGSVFVRQSWKFPKPVYIGDTITAVGTVKTVQAKRRMAEMEFRVTNQNGDVVLEGDALVYQADASG